MAFNLLWLYVEGDPPNAGDVHLAPRVPVAHAKKDVTILRLAEVCQISGSNPCRDPKGPQHVHNRVREVHAVAAMIAEQPADAVRFLTRALARPGGAELSPRAEADLLTTRAEAHVAAGKPDLAMADLTRATTLSPEYFTPWLLKATLARRGGDLVTAEAALLKAAALAPGSADVELEAGNIASAKGDTALARQAWEAAATDAPDTPAGQAAAAALGRMNAALPEKPLTEKPLTEGALPATPR